MAVDTADVTTAAPAPTKEEPELGLWQVIAPVNREIRTAMACSALSAVAWFASIALILPIAQEVLRPDPDLVRVWWLVAAILGLVVVAFVTRVWSFVISHRGAFKLEEHLRLELTTHLARVPLGYVINAGSGTLKKIVMDDVRALHAFVADSTPIFAKAIATPLLALILMFALDWRLTLISLVLFPIVAIAMRLAFKDYGQIRIRLDEANEHINRTIIEYVQGMQVVRTFDDGSASFERYRDALRRATAVTSEWTRTTNVPAYMAKTLLAALPGLIVVLGAGIPMHRAGGVDLPTFLMFAILAPTVSESIVPLVWLQQFITNASASVKRIGALKRVDELAEPAVSAEPRDSSVQLEDVTFRYTGRDDDALTGVNIEIPPGSVTALVGPSGAGKGTVAQLICRFWDVGSGRVRVGGQDVRNLTSDVLMKHVAFVFQTPFLLHDTVRENLRLGKPDATEEEIVAAAKAARAHEFILTELPDGYDTVISERGSSLSGGQRQRITIARAILQDCPIIVLDEATAFADPDNEAQIHQALSELTAGKTIIVVAHRLSTVRDAHQIVVLDEGRVAQAGTHDELLAQGGIYARLWSRFEQAQGWGLRTGTTEA